MSHGLNDTPYVMQSGVKRSRQKQSNVVRGGLMIIAEKLYDTTEV